jgi:hypothetical protein
MSELKSEVSELKLQIIKIYYQGCLDGLLLNDCGKFEYSEMFEVALTQTQDYFYHYPIYQVELEYFLQKFNA